MNRVIYVFVLRVKQELNLCWEQTQPNISTSSDHTHEPLYTQHTTCYQTKCCLYNI